MSVEPPNISPRLRSRQSIGAAVSAPKPAHSETSALRVLIRLPNVASPSATSPRFKIATRLFSTLKRKYAAAAFALFVVCMVAMLLRGKRGAEPHDEAGGDAPHWNNPVTITPGKEAPSGPILQSAAGQPNNDGPKPWSAAQSPIDASRRPALDGTSWNRPAASAATAAAANPASSPKGDNLPAMSTRYPVREAMTERTPTRTSTPAWPASEYRTAQAPDPSAAGPSRPIAGFEQSNPARFTGRIDPAPTQSPYDPAGPRPYR